MLQGLQALKAKAKAQGLWNLFLPPSPQHDTEDYRGAGLTNLDYALCAQEMGRLPFASEVFKLLGADTGNMEVLHRYGSPAQKDRWLKPLMAGDIRSAFLIVPSRRSPPRTPPTSPPRSCATATTTSSTGASGGLRASVIRAGEIAIVMGKSDPEAARHQQQSQILVPMDAPVWRLCGCCRCSATTMRRTAMAR